MLKLSLNKPLFNISHPFSCKLFRVRYTPASFFANLRSPSYSIGSGETIMASCWSLKYLWSRRLPHTHVLNAPLSIVPHDTDIVTPGPGFRLSVIVSGSGGICHHHWIMWIAITVFTQMATSLTRVCIISGLSRSA